MSTMTGKLLRRNRHLLGVVKVPSILVSQALNPQRAQLQPSAQSLSERYAAGAGSEDLEEQNQEAIAQAAPTLTSDTSSTSRRPEESKSNIKAKQVPSKVNFKDTKSTSKSSQLFPHMASQEGKEKDHKDLNVGFSAKRVESPQNKLSKDEQVDAGRWSSEPLVKVPPSARNESNNAGDAGIKEPGSKSEPANTEQPDRSYITQLKQIKAMHEANYAEQDSRISKVETELATTNAGLQEPAAKAQQKVLLPNRYPGSLALPQQAKRLQTRVNIGAINVEVIEPKAGTAATPASARRQAKRSPRRSYQGQSGVRKHFGFGQL